MNNKKRGSNFEKVVCRVLANEGYWVHFITPDARGAQPFDIIAVRNGIAVAIECKTLADNLRYFPITRLEENQQMAFQKWFSKGNAMAYVAIGWKGKIYFVEYSDIKALGKIDMREQEARA